MSGRLFKNHARIAAFDQWRDKITAKAASDLREKIARSAEAALPTVDLETTERFRLVRSYVDGTDSGVFWTLDTLFEAGSDTGVWIEVWLPAKNVTWLSPGRSEYRPRIGLYAHAGTTKTAKQQAMKWLETARAAVRHVPKGAHKSLEDEEDGYYGIFDRTLFDELAALTEEGENRLTPKWAGADGRTRDPKGEPRRPHLDRPAALPLGGRGAGWPWLGA